MTKEELLKCMEIFERHHVYVSLMKSGLILMTWIAACHVQSVNEYAKLPYSRMYAPSKTFNLQELIVLTTSIYNDWLRERV